MAPPLGTDPDDVVDLLPKPYRFVAKVLDSILESVGEKIHDIEKKRRSDEHEFGLPRISANGSHRFTGRVSCVGMDPQGSDFIALGTSHGRVLLVDAKEHRPVAEEAPFGTDEEIRCLATSSATTFRVHPKSEAAEAQKQPCPKLVVAGASSPRVLAYDISSDVHGPTLKPLCSVDLQLPPADGGGGDGSAESAQPPVAQLCCCGSVGALWLAVLLSSGSCAVYLLPPGPADLKGKAGQEVLVDATIHEEEEGDEDGATGRSGSEFGGLPVISVPLYRFDIPSMVAIAGQPEPPLSSLLASAFCAAPERRAPQAAPPLALLLASTETNAVQCFSLQPPERAVPPVRSESGMRPAAFVLGALAQPEAALPAQARRRWLLPARTTVHAVASDAAVFALGGSDGSVALFGAAPGPALRAMLPGHYAAVSAMAFSGSGTLLTVGRDSWAHIYCVGKQALATRCLLTPPPTAPPGVDYIAAPSVPMALALDAQGSLRLFDVRQCRKLAAAHCQRPEAEAPGETVSWRRVLASNSGFCVLADIEGPRPVPAPGPAEGAEAAAEAPQAGAAGGEAPEAAAESTELHFFDHSDFLPRLFRGIAARVEAGGRAEGLFRSLTAEQLLHAPDSPRSATRAPEKASAPLTAANLERAQAGGLAGEEASVAAAVDAPRLVPETWQATVRGYLRRGLGEKAARQVRRQQRVEQLRRQLEQAA